jgi:hypothetical protein
MGLRMDAASLRDWMPVRLSWQSTQGILDWCYVGDERFTEPFFAETVQRLLRHPFNQLLRRQTPLEVLAELHERTPGLAPTGFIFHLSRCGSTLVSQMLAALAQNIVVSEAAPVDAVLRAHMHVHGVTDDERQRWLRWIVSALGRPHRADEQHYFIKFDCWHTLDLPLIHATFPDVPWMFLFRDPVEVIVSHLRHRGAHTLPWVVAPEMFGLDADAGLRLAPEDYTARVLAAICRAALEHRHTGDALFVDYRQLPNAVESLLPNFFRVTYSADERQLMHEAAQRDAKNPVMHFAADTDAKRRAATDGVRQAAARWLDPLHRQLADLAQQS